MAKYRVMFEIDEDVDADNRYDAISIAISNACGGGYFENELTEKIMQEAYVEEIDEDE